MAMGLKLSRYLAALLALLAVDGYAAEPMQGFPPASDSQVTAFNYLQWPASRWSFRNIGAVLNTVPLPRSGSVRTLPVAKGEGLAAYSACNSGAPINELGKKQPCEIRELFAANYADGLLILHNGEIVLEQYFHKFTEHSHHIWFSATKSLVATAFGILVAQQQVDLTASPVRYIPELAGSGWERVSIQQVLDHSTALDFQENYTDAHSDFARYYLPAMNMSPVKGSRDMTPADTKIFGVYDFLQHFIRPNPKLQAGVAFEYSSPNADLLGWLITRISGMPLEQFLRQNLWSRIGAEHDALMVVDRAGMAVATGGMNSTLRDAGRFAELVRQRGKVGEQQVVPAEWIDASLQVDERSLAKMRANSRYQQMPYQAYRNMWWILDAEAGEYMASGVYGQVIYINRQAGVSALWFSSQPVAAAPQSSSFQKKLAAVRGAAAFLQNPAKQAQ